MINAIGKTVFCGTAIAKIYFLNKEESVVVRKKIEDPENEIKRYEAAKQKTIAELQTLYQKVLVEVGELNAQIFEVHQMMLEDDDYNESVWNIIRNQKINAEYAVAITGDNFFEMFANMEDEYFKARAIDIKDISERIIDVLSGKKAGISLGNEPVILVAEDLAPSETVQLNKEKLLGFVTHLGSANSHTAILARTMGIPALIGANISSDWDGRYGIIDGNNSLFIVDPDEATMNKYQEIQK